MHTRLQCIATCAALLGAAPALAAEYPIDIKTDIKGQYFIVEKTGTANNPIVLTKQVRPNNTTYFIKRWFDCKKGTVRYLGEGETLDAINKATPEPETTAIEEGSIPDQLAKHVCPKK